VESKLDEAAAAAVGQNKWGDPTVFGPRILNLSWADGRSSGEELHGTSRPDQLGGNVSHGCVRHYNEDILELYKRVSVGEKVAIVERIDSGLLKLPTTSPVSAIS
jgi:lipoprotein-anchoring transpeptidase ErfK/SrfK